ncbi:MAG: hypothetical protein HUK08_02800 [Bacteroidaceae bacterium]|nr:hypothetical protein [Bacteroidaceae bacterium]
MKPERFLTWTNLMVFVCIAVNSLFVIKYGLRVLPASAVTGAVIVYSGIWVSLTYCCRNRYARELVANKWTVLLLFILILTTIIFLHIYIDPYSINVDRWSAIDGWGRYLLDGRYPYDAPTHLNGKGSPFPVWQLFHLPFVMLGDVGYGFTASLILFFALLWKDKEYGFLGSSLVLMGISPAFWYEVAVRSDLFYNILLLALLTKYLKHYSPYTVAVLAALFFCTRLVCVIPIAILCLQWYVKECKWETRIFMAMIFAGIVVAVFLPFVLWPDNDLLSSDISPLRLQTRQGGLFQLLLCLCLVVVAAWTKTKNNYYAITAAVMFTFFVFCGIYNENTLNYDITYISTALPFAIFALCKPNKLG